MGRHMQGPSQKWVRHHEQICPFAHWVLDLFLLSSPLEGASLVLTYKNLSSPRWGGSLVSIMFVRHFKELNKNVVSLSQQHNFRIEVLRCKPDFSFHLLTPGEIVYLKFKQYLGKENFSLYVVGKANERKAPGSD